MNSLLSLLTAFVLTVLIECGLSLISRSKTLVYCVFLCNLLTNPLLNLLLLVYYNLAGRENYWLVVAVMELIVVVAEAFVINIMTTLSRKKAWLLSLALNAASFGTGLLLTRLQVPLL